MKLIFLYGPPAVGKFTAAKELAAITGFKLFHNHLTVDVVTSIFEHGSDSYFRLLRKIRFSILEAAAAANIPGVIMTFVYGPSRQGVVGQYVKVVESNGGEICFVRLYCERAVLAQRVVAEDRRKYGKIISEARLNETLKELEDPFATIVDKESLSLDVGKLLPFEAAEMIKRHYNLPETRP
jgi:hypothetical protein